MALTMRCVARAIAACAVPVVAGIGHATDTTIADAAADVCAPTPSAAAELVTAAQHKVEERVVRLQQRVLRAGSYEMLRARQRLSRLSAEAVLRSLRDGLRRRAQRVDELEFRVQAVVARGTKLRAERLTRMQARLQRQDVQVRVADGQRRLELLRGGLERAGRAVIADRRARVERGMCASGGDESAARAGARICAGVRAGWEAAAVVGTGARGRCGGREVGEGWLARYGDCRREVRCPMYSIRPVELPLDGLDALAKEAAAEGRHLIERLENEWADGRNRFDGRGEVLLGVFCEGRLIGIGGLQRDPFTGLAGVGRLRRVYVLSDYRGRGEGTALVNALLERAKQSFCEVRLRTNNPDAVRLYEKAGFTCFTADRTSHRLTLKSSL